MKKSIWRAVAVASLVGLFSGLGIGAAQAYWNVVSVNGGFCTTVCWTTRSLADTTNKLGGVSIQKSPNADPISPNLVGVQARLYVSSSGALCTASSMAYNSVTVTTFYNSTGGPYCGHVEHRSRGLTTASPSWPQVVAPNLYVNF